MTAILESLRKSCSDWAVGEGSAYKASSRSRWYPEGKNERSPNTLSCTVHDIGLFDDFKNWMDSRSMQADALAHDIETFKALRRDESMSDMDVQYFDKSFTERASMALYGVDLDTQGEKLSRVKSASGDPVYPDMSGVVFDSDKMAWLSDKLRDFKSGWDKIQADEWAGYDYTRKTHAGPVASVGTQYGWTEGDNFNVFSFGMLNRYIVEVNARLRAHDALSGRERDPMDIHVSLNPEHSPERVDECRENYDLFAKVAHLSGGYGPAGVSLFDGQGLVQAAGRQVAAERESMKSRARDTRDLDAACAGLEGERPEADTSFDY